MEAKVSLLLQKNKQAVDLQVQILSHMVPSTTRQFLNVPVPVARIIILGCDSCVQHRLKQFSSRRNGHDNRTRFRALDSMANTKRNSSQHRLQRPKNRPWYLVLSLVFFKTDINQFVMASETTPGTGSWTDNPQSGPVRKCRGRPGHARPAYWSRAAKKDERKTQGTNAQGIKLSGRFLRKTVTHSVLILERRFIPRHCKDASWSRTLS